jgi:hypothetical protein
VTIKPSPQIPTQTGIPPHLHHKKLTTSCLKLCKLTLTKARSITLDVKKAVCDANKLKAFETAIVMMQSLGEMLTLHHKQMDSLDIERLQSLQTAFAPTETVTHTPKAN